MPLNELLRYRDNWQRAVTAKIPLTAQQRRVLDVVVEHIGISDSKGYSKGVCKLTNAAIAEHAGIKGERVPERVRRHLKPLLDAEALLVTQKAVGGNGRLKRARHLTMGDFASLSVAETEGNTPTKPKGDTPTKPKGNTPTKPRGNTPTNKQTPPRNCGDSLDQRSGRDKKTSSYHSNARVREAHEVVDGLPPELEGMTRWELEMLGVWLDGTSPSAAHAPLRGLAPQSQPPLTSRTLRCQPPLTSRRA